MKSILAAADSLKSVFTGEDEEEVESSNPSADSILERMPNLNPFDNYRSPSSPNGSKSLTPGRKKTLREQGWDGVQGTHKEQKYVKLQQLEQRRKEAKEQAKAHSGNRAETFHQLAQQLDQRIRRQHERIIEAEA